MKLPKASGDKLSRKANARNRTQRVRDQSPQMRELLKMCLQKICELQADMESDIEMHDAEAAGYSACAVETIRFLSEHGLPSDHPMVKTIMQKLFRKRD